MTEQHYWEDHEKRMADPRYATVSNHGREARITEPVTVQPWVVLYAIRYGMGRQSYADSDAARLVTEHAAVLEAKGWIDTLTRDIEERLLQPGVNQTDRVKWLTALDALVTARYERQRAEFAGPATRDAAADRIVEESDELLERQRHGGAGG